MIWDLVHPVQTHAPGMPNNPAPFDAPDVAAVGDVRNGQGPVDLAASWRHL
jgi:hypothetical protein